MYLIVGLGNPGQEYDNTRHNIGFYLIDQYLSKNNLSLNNEKFKGSFGKFNINGEEVIIAKPLTYMNLSGEFIRDIIKFYKIDLNNVLIIYDDMDLPLGKLRLKDNGSAGGHNGIKSIIQCLGTQNFKRIKFGIDKPCNKSYSIVDYVLGKFNSEERKIISSKLSLVNEVIDYFIKGESFLRLMNKFN